MSLILGKEYCRIDSNGRFKFPIALKRQLEEGEVRFVIKESIYAECLELWTYGSFQAEVEQLQQKLNPYSIEDRKILRKMTDGNIIELDTNDRLVIPAEQKGRIGSAKDIVLQSTGNYIEIWDIDTYNAMNSDLGDMAAMVDARLGVKSANDEQ